MSLVARRSLVDRAHPSLPVVRQCQLLDLARSSVYYRPVAVDPADLALMRAIDEQYLKTPSFGTRRMVVMLRRQGHIVNRKRVQRLMRQMGIEAIYQKPNTSKKHPEHEIFPYLLRDLTIDRINQVWCADITYIPMAKGFVYLVAIMDWASRRVLAWRLSNTMEADFCVEALEEAVARFGQPEIFNTDQGSQFTGNDFTGVLKREGIKISMDGKGRFMDNIFVERLWRSVKYEEVFIKAYASVAEARSGIGTYLSFYNDGRPHQSLEYQTPRQAFEAGLWICGRSASPTGCASPMSPAEEAGNMGKCSPSPTYPQAPQQQPEMYIHLEEKALQSLPSSPVRRVDA